MAAFRRVDDLRSRSVSSMGSLYLYLLRECIGVNGEREISGGQASTNYKLRQLSHLYCAHALQVERGHITQFKCCFQVKRERWSLRLNSTVYRPSLNSVRRWTWTRSSWSNPLGNPRRYTFLVLFVWSWFNMRRNDINSASGRAYRDMSASVVDTLMLVRVLLGLYLMRLQG